MESNKQEENLQLGSSEEAFLLDRGWVKLSDSMTGCGLPNQHLTDISIE